MRQVMLVEWTELLWHAKELGFAWNYAHELLRAFQYCNGTMDIECEEIEEVVPMYDFLGDFEKKHKSDGDLNQMGRDIVYDFMQTHNLKEMTVSQD